MESSSQCNQDALCQIHIELNSLYSLLAQVLACILQAKYGQLQYREHFLEFFYNMDITRCMLHTGLDEVLDLFCRVYYIVCAG